MKQRLLYNLTACGLAPQFNCTKVKTFLSRRLGQYVTNVTRAAEVCSDFLCRSNGRCVRRDALARHYLHLSAAGYRIRPSGDGGFAVSGRHSRRELRLLAERFRCHCYEGHEGERCDGANEEREEGGGGAGQEEKEEERRRKAWEEERGERWEAGESEAAPTGRGGVLMLLALLLNLTVVT